MARELLPAPLEFGTSPDRCHGADIGSVIDPIPPGTDPAATPRHPDEKACQMSEEHRSTLTPGATEPNVHRPVRWAWCGAFIVTAIFGFGLTPWETIGHLAENKGPGDEGTLMLAFAAGYTLPATVGVLAAVLIVNRKVFG